MKAYLLTTGTIFALIGAMHLSILVMRWRVPLDAEFIIENGVLGGLSAALALWAFRLVGRASAATRLSSSPSAERGVNRF